jgi:hypothetical protein
LVTFVVTQNLVSIIFSPSMMSRVAALFALDIIEGAARHYDEKAACLGRSREEAKRLLTVTSGRYHN